jgi:hypothetical protein
MFRIKSAVFYVFYLWPFLFLVGPTLYAMFRDKEFRIVLISVLTMGSGLALEMWPSTPHYAAAWTGAVVLMVLYSLRRFRDSHLGLGAPFTRAVAIVLGICLLCASAERLRDPLDINPLQNSTDSQRAAENFGIPLEVSRQRIEADLKRRPGKQLVIVHHPYHDVPAMDWIYNEADIDHSKIIWVRDMGYLKNEELIKYYSDRQVWYVDRGDPIARIVAYDDAILPWKLALEKFETTSRSGPQQASAAPEATLKIASETGRLSPSSGSVR